jgi:hypothetical protein
LAAFDAAGDISSTPIRQNLPGSCVRAASGHNAAAPPSSVIGLASYRLCQRETSLEMRQVFMAGPDLPPAGL